MKANPDKYNLLVTTNALTFVNINSFQITNSTEEKLLGIKFDSKLSFQNHASSLCKKASQKLHALTRIANYVNLSYYPLVWMFHSRKRNPRINSIHEGEIRVKYQDYQSMLLQLLQKDNSSIHQRNLQVIATEIFKAKNDLSPEIMKEV